MGNKDRFSLRTTEKAKRIKKQLKTEFPDCKFSVRTEYFSGGSSITVALMVADRKMKLRFDEIPDHALHSYRNRNYSDDELRKYQNGHYHQLGRFYGKYDIDTWTNGVFLTYQGWMVMRRVQQIVDYYHTKHGFYRHLQLGKYDRPFVDGNGYVDDGGLMDRIAERDAEIKVEQAKADALKKRREEERRQLRKVDRPSVPSGATHVIDGSGFRKLTREERETGLSREKLEDRWFKDTDWSNVVFEL